MRLFTNGVAQSVSHEGDEIVIDLVCLPEVEGVRVVLAEPITVPAGVTAHLRFSWVDSPDGPVMRTQDVGRLYYRAGDTISAVWGARR